MAFEEATNYKERRRYTPSYWSAGRGMDQRHILKDRRPNTAAYPACWAMGTKELKECMFMVKKIYFVLGRPEQPRKNKNLLYQHDKPYEPTKKEPLSLVLF
jgi:hypothetical protein